MGGDISVTSQHGKGSCFCFTLPVEAVDTGKFSEVSLNSNIIGIKPGRAEIKVLAVGDDITSGDLITSVLQSIGINTQQASNREDAVRINTEWQPDVIIIDVSMPVMDGLDVFREIINVSADRKSTRLNSSHRCISYAVFCLKKKKQPDTH